MRGLSLVISLNLMGVLHLAVGKEFKFEYHNSSPDSIEVRVRYDGFRINDIEYGSFPAYKPIKHPIDLTASLELTKIQKLTPCTFYKFNVTVINLERKKNFSHIEIILMTSNIHAICYDNLTTTLRWISSIGDHSTKYDVIISSNKAETMKLVKSDTTTTNEYNLDFLDGCSKYIITVESQNHPNSSRNISIQTGFKVPDPPRALKKISQTSSSVTFEIMYNNTCKIVSYHVFCYNREKFRGISGSEAVLTICDLTSDKYYNCTAAIASGAGWSNATDAMDTHIFVSSLTTVISIVAIGTAIIVFLILISLACWCRSNRKPNTQTDIYWELSPFFNPRKRPSNELIRKKFKTICDMDLNHLNKSFPNKEAHNNINKSAIVPYKFNRVVLKPNKYCLTDYINASYIDGGNAKRQYIATHWPNQRTIYDFWHMVLQEQCSRIVTLAQLVNNGSSQCVQYYPKLNETLKFHNIIVRNTNETKFENIIKRSLIVSRDEMKIHVLHCQYTDWFNANHIPYPLDLIEFIEVSGVLSKKTSSPIIVHSSNGSGRTGTFIALDILFQNLRLSNTISVSETVTKLQCQRCNMVQTLDQYEFLYASIEMFYLTRMYKRNCW